MHEGHRKRLKDRFKSEGIDSFQPHEVLEMLLFFCIPRRDTNLIAHKLLKKFGSISGVFEADIKDLMDSDGIGENSAFLLSLIPSISRRYFNDKWGSKVVIDSSSTAGDYAVSLFMGRTYEAFFLICLDSQNRVNYSALIQEGTINESPVYPRLIVETALRHQANSVILAHNHPGGSMKPSLADIEVTEKIKGALEAISISVIDHIIVAGDKYVSFAERGILRR